MFLKKLYQKYTESILRQIFSDPLGLLSSFLVLLIITLALFAPQLAPYDPTSIDVFNKLAPPSHKHLLGTDQLGRDLLSRVIFGARIALMVSLPAILLGLIVGTTLGVIAGYTQTWLDSLLVIVFDIVRSFPTLVFGVAVMALTGPSMIVLIAVVGITRFPGYSRLIRGQTLKIKENEYIMASRGFGASSARIMLRHILPNAIAPVFIQAAMDLPTVITIEAGLSFLGLGVPPPNPSWGVILKNGHLYIYSAPWIVIFGGIALILATLGFTFLGEQLRDSLDPRLRHSMG